MKKIYSVPELEVIELVHEGFMGETQGPGPGDQGDPSVGGDNPSPNNYMEFEKYSERSDLKNPNVWE